MNTPVYVHGGGQTVFGELYSHGLLELFALALDEALGEAELSRGDVQAIYCANMLGAVLGGYNHLSVQLRHYLGVDCPVFTVSQACASGGVAVHLARQGVQSGAYDTVVVLGGEKMTDQEPSVVTQALMGATSVEEQLGGLSLPQLYGLMAQEYLDVYGLPATVLDYGPLLGHRQSVGNPLAQFQQVVRPETVRESAVVSSPLRLFHCSPITDGASALVLRRAESAVRVVDSVLGYAPPALADRQNRLRLGAVEQAAEQLTVRPSECTVLELHDCFSIAQILAVEALGLAAAGAGHEVLREAYERPDDQRVINRDGGLKANGHPVGATGVRQLVTAYRALRSGPRGQNALTQNLGGTGGSCVIHTLNRC